jgi:Fe-S-cluster containining protein
VPIAIHARPAEGPSPLSRPDIQGIWTRAAAELGWRLERTDRSYASTDGRGTIFIGTDASLDPDDSVAQLVFHELCHGLVEGPSAWVRPDWSFGAEDSRDLVREHACLRLQIALSRQFGLSDLMAPTTVHRAYHDAVTGDPLREGLGEAEGDDRAAGLARSALERAESAHWLKAIREALAATARALGPVTAVADSPLAGATLDSAGVGASGRDSSHPAGFAWGPAERTCAECAWLHHGGRGRPVHRCRQASRGEGDAGARVEPTTRACARFEPPVDCQTCGACCREAYHSVTVAVRDPVVWKHPELIVRHGHRFEIRRSGDRCAALHALDPVDAPGHPGVVTSPARPKFACAIYQDRPHPCREFEAGGRHCLVARRRVGLSAGGAG